MSAQETVGEAVRRFRDANGLCHDEHLARVWIVRAGLVTLWLPNFAWRRRAIDAHDMHHFLTGYPCTVMGEFQIAAWELAAGRYPHWGATLFCAPLVVLGLFWDPCAIISAWAHGRRSHSLYTAANPDALLEAPMTWASGYVGLQSPARCHLLAAGGIPDDGGE